MTELDKTIDAVKQYIASVRLDVTGLDRPNDNLKLVFKLYKGILIIRLVVSQSNLSDNSKRFFDETISDISSAIVLTISGMYKPARLLLRGAIESVLRFSIERSGGVSSEADSVTKLIEIAKTSYEDHKVVRGAMGSLTGSYADLCKTIHVTDPNLMELRVPFVDLFEYDQNKFDKNVIAIRIVLSALVPMMFCLSHEWISRIDHGNADALRALIPADKKKLFREYLTAQ